MGWSRGTELFEAIAPELKSLSEKKRKRIYEKMLEVTDDLDWDTQYKAIGLDPVLDELLKELGHVIDEDEYDDEE